MADLFSRLKAQSSHEWKSYTEHAFLDQLAEGTLPKKAFQFYLMQDYLFLIQFARAKALAIYKSRSLADMRAANAALAAILSEMDLHVRLCGQWGLTSEDIEGTQEHNATIAYTRYVLDCGFTGDLLDLVVALAPCVIGYGEIALRLAPRVAQREGHPYGEWVAEYAGEAYQSAVREARADLDRLAGPSISEQRFQQLTRIFATASRLEADFWQMGLDNVK